VVDVDLKEHKIILDDNNQVHEKNHIDYDIVIFSHGASVNTFNISGVDKYCEFIKNNDNIERIKNKLKTIGPEANVVVIGCGPTGVETIGYLMDNTKFNLLAIDAFSLPLSMYPTQSIDYLLDLWKTKNVQFKLRSPVMKITENEIITQNEKIKYDLAFWCGGIKPNELTNKILQRLSINKVAGIPVNDYLQIKNGNTFIPNTYAIGDCSFGFGPPVAQKAVQQGIYLAQQLNTNGDTSGKSKSTSTPFVYNYKGQITYIGDNKSVFYSYTVIVNESCISYWYYRTRWILYGRIFIRKGL
jgi:NADH dehydrogenase FAD-containing subunit